MTNPGSRLPPRDDRKIKLSKSRSAPLLSKIDSFSRWKLICLAFMASIGLILGIAPRIMYYFFSSSWGSNPYCNHIALCGIPTHNFPLWKWFSSFYCFLFGFVIKQTYSGVDGICDIFPPHMFVVPDPVISTVL